MQNNQQQPQQKLLTGVEKEKDQPQNNLPGNFPRFSVQIPSPGKGTPNQQRHSKRNDNFQGFAKKMESTNTKQDDDSISMISAIPQQLDESLLNETINKELHKERNLVLQYVNSSLNDHTAYIKELGKEMKEQQFRNKDLSDKQSLMMRTQISQIEQNYQLELEQMKQTFTMIVQDQKQALQNQLQENESRIYNYCSDIEKRLDTKIAGLNQRLQLQLDMKDNKLNEGQALKKLDADIQNINNKIIQIQQLQNLDDLTGFNAQLATFSQEIQYIKQQIRKYKEDLDVKMVEINENTKQFLKNSMSQNSNNLISNQNYKDKIFEGQIEEIQRYITGFSKVVQNKLSITNEDLNLYLENDNNGNQQQKGGQKNPFSFGGGYNVQNAERISTLGTMQSAEFEVKENNKIILKKDQNTQQQQQTQQQYQQYQNIPQQQQGNLQKVNNTGRMSYSPTKYTNSNPSNASDYYNIFQETAPNSVYGNQNHQDSSYQSSQQQPQKKKKKIFQDEASLPPMMNNNYIQQPVRQTRNINPSPSRAQLTTKPEQKNIHESSAQHTIESYTQRTESDQVEFGTMPNKESFQSQGYYQNQHPILDSKLSVKVNENVEVYNDMNELTDSDSEEQQSSYSNFRLKDTMDFIQREVIPGSNTQGNQIQPFQQQQPQQQIQMQQQYQQQQQMYPQQNQQNQQNINVKSAVAESLIKFSQINQSQQANTNMNVNSTNSANHKRLNTIQESEQEQYSSKIDEQNRQNMQQINNYMSNKVESNAKNTRQSKPNSYENYEDFKIQMPKQENLQDSEASKSKGTPKHKITNEALNFMIASKGKSSFGQAYQAQQNLPGYIQNDNVDDFRPKWGYDSQASRSETGEEIEYQLDEEGYLLDEKGQFLLDDNGQKIQLNQDNINFLAQNKMLFDA